jgi:2,3,4,5-tetrahydropyridine-2,6-dicarboxylate N-acetyltransferase
MIVEREKLIDLIANSKKRTPIQFFVHGNLNEEILGKYDFEWFGGNGSYVIFAELEEVERFVSEQTSNIINKHVIMNCRNSAVNLYDLSQSKSRIEPGAIIREFVEIGDGCIIMMGAVINVGARIGDYSMIDMNAVVGSNCVIGKNVHISAGAVICGVIEPPSKEPVIIKDNVFVGANAVILEGVTIEESAIIAAGAVVLKDVSANTVVAGNPAKVLKYADSVSMGKVKNEKAIRNMEK